MQKKPKDQQARRKKQQADDEAAPRRPWWHWAALAAGILAVAFLGWQAYDWLGPILFPAHGIPTNFSVAKLSADDLFAEYARNPPAANPKSSEQFITLKGKVGKVVPPQDQAPPAPLL